MTNRPSPKLRMALAAILVAGVGLSACSKLERNRGYIPDPEDLAAIEIGATNKTGILESLGSPSAVGTFDDDAWYYMRSHHERIAFFPEEVTHREVVAIYFDDQNRVTDVAHYGLQDGFVVAYSERRTPTRGRELTILEQLLGNVGRGTIPTPTQ